MTSSFYWAGEPAKSICFKERTQQGEYRYTIILASGEVKTEDLNEREMLRLTFDNYTCLHNYSLSPSADLPDGNPKTAMGALKPPLVSVIPPAALIQMAEVMRLGKAKYGAFNWRDQNVTASTYLDAAMRHILSWWDGETIDPESGQPHLAHAMASLAIISDAIATGNATDDRPKPGVASKMIADAVSSR